MKYCRYCKIKVQSGSRCPLCSVELEEQDSGATESVPSISVDEDNKYPEFTGKPTDRYNFILRLFLLISVVAGSTSLLINIMTFAGVLWSVAVICGILFLWATLVYPLFARRNIGHFIIVDAISLSALIYMIELFTDKKGWGLTYVTPFLLIGATFMITLLILVQRPKWRTYTVYQTIMVILGFAPVLFVLFGLVTAAWPSILSAFYSFLTFSGMYILGHKKYENELKKRFHI